MYAGSSAQVEGNKKKECNFAEDEVVYGFVHPLNGPSNLAQDFFLLLLFFLT